MSYNDLEQLKAEMLHRQNRYYLALRNYGESYDRLPMQNAEQAHERLERVYQKYLDAKQKYLDALDEYIFDTPMTEYTSL